LPCPAINETKSFYCLGSTFKQQKQKMPKFVEKSTDEKSCEKGQID
jgi:hypothetical protein